MGIVPSRVSTSMGCQAEARGKPAAVVVSCFARRCRQCQADFQASKGCQTKAAGRPAGVRSTSL
eukprot:1149083-Pelagomonas_calceolata.AAC.5